MTIWGLTRGPHLLKRQQGCLDKAIGSVAFDYGLIGDKRGRGEGVEEKETIMQEIEVGVYGNE
uniref:Uncharacterized protein n=1 Tax=Rhizophora mucronata TaxID=61149 RepID=A0A2P2N1X9_RHIMU